MYKSFRQGVFQDSTRLFTLMCSILLNSFSKCFAIDFHFVYVHICIVCKFRRWKFLNIQVTCKSCVIHVNLYRYYKMATQTQNVNKIFQNNEILFLKFSFDLSMKRNHRDVKPWITRVMPTKCAEGIHANCTARS